MKIGSSKKSPSGTYVKTSGVTVVSRNARIPLVHCTLKHELKHRVTSALFDTFRNVFSDSRLLRHLALVRLSHLWYIYIGFGLQILVRKNFISTNEKGLVNLRKVTFYPHIKQQTVTFEFGVVWQCSVIAMNHCVHFDASSYVEISCLEHHETFINLIGTHGNVPIPTFLPFQCHTALVKQ